MKYALICILIAIMQTGCDLRTKDVQREFERRRLNDGIQVGAPDAWRWARDGIEMDSVVILAGQPTKKAIPPQSLPNALTTWEYPSDIDGANHRLIFNEDGLLMFCEWYSGFGEDKSLLPPSPAIANRLEIEYPRCVPLAWTGNTEIGYQAEVDIYIPKGEWTHSARYFTKNNRTVHLHTGANAGRWRVRALSTKGYGPWSEYVEFKCIR